MNDYMIKPLVIEGLNLNLSMDDRVTNPNDLTTEIIIIHDEIYKLSKGFCRI